MELPGKRFRVEQPLHNGACRCGLCCTEFSIGSFKSAAQVCPLLSIKANLAVCKSHEGSRPERCQTFVCVENEFRRAQWFLDNDVLDALSGRRDAQLSLLTQPSRRLELSEYVARLNQEFGPSAYTLPILERIFEPKREPLPEGLVEVTHLDGFLGRNTESDALATLIIGQSLRKPVDFLTKAWSGVVEIARLGLKHNDHFASAIFRFQKGDMELNMDHMALVGMYKGVYTREPDPKLVMELQKLI